MLTVSLLNKREDKILAKGQCNAYTKFSKPCERMQFLTEQGISGFEVFEDNLKHCL